MCPDSLTTQITTLQRQLIGALGGACKALQRIAGSIPAPTSHSAAALGRDAQELRHAARELDDELILLHARYAPVAGDLRHVIALQHVAQHAGLIANQLALITEQLIEIDSDAAGTRDITQLVATMAAHAGRQLHDALRALGAQSESCARAVEVDDDALDDLNRAVFDAARTADDRDHRRCALRYVLIARSLERIGDNAVDIAEQAAYLATAELREFTDASTPRGRPRPAPGA